MIMEKKWSIDKLQSIWQLASKLHNGQKYGSSELDEQIEYINHIGSVVFEILNASNFSDDFDVDLAMHCAVLHDTIEDTAFQYSKAEKLFGKNIAQGVLALTKDERLLDKEKMMLDSLGRIKKQPKEVWAVKMADRICNLYAPPFYWDNEKKTNYMNEAKLIHTHLKDGNRYLADRLEKKIEDYKKFIN